jgi:cell division protein FtsN
MGKQQRGGTILGLIIGLILGLGIALGVAVYVTKVPVPFINKGDKSNTEASEAERNRNWDPNSPLYGGTPSRAPAVPAVVPPSTAVVTPPVDPVAKPPAASADPLGDLANAQVKASEAKTQAANAAKAVATSEAAAAPAADGYSYFVQAGAFRTQGDADAQRAKLAMLGWEARISEREQNGRPVFRVRVGPFAKRGDAEQLKQKFDGAGVDSALVRVQQ